MSKQTKPVMRTAEAAAYLGFTPGTLRFWRHRNEGPKWFRLGQKIVMYRVEDLDKWIAENYDDTSRGA